MKKIMFALLFVSLPFATSCKKKGSAGEAMSKMTEYRDRMCACTDSACAQKVSDEMTRWGQDQARANKEPPKMSDEETRKFTQIGADMGQCMQKAMGTGAMTGSAMTGSGMTGSAMGADTTGTTGSAGTTGAAGTDMNGSAGMGSAGMGATGTGTTGTTGSAGMGGGTTGTTGTMGSANAGTGAGR